MNFGPAAYPEGVSPEREELRRLVEDLRTLANAERGTLALKKEPTDLGALVDDAAAAFAVEAAAKHVAIRVAESISNL